jgi:hypothetical protein
MCQVVKLHGVFTSSCKLAHHGSVTHCDCPGASHFMDTFHFSVIHILAKYIACFWQVVQGSFLGRDKVLFILHAFRLCVRSTLYTL